MAAALPNDFSAVSARCPPESSRPFLGKILMVNGNSTTVTSRGRPVQVVQNYIVHRRLSHVFRALEQRQERQRTGGRSNAKRAGNATDAPDHALGHMPVGNPEQAAFTTVDAHLDNQQFAPPPDFNQARFGTRSIMRLTARFSAKRGSAETRLRQSDYMQAVRPIARTAR